MLLNKYIAKQLAKPSGFLGSLILPRLWNRRNSALNDLAFTCMNLKPDDRIFEAGFGGGYLLGKVLEVLSDGFVAGIDGSPEIVEFCSKKFKSFVKEGKLELKSADVESIPFISENFTKVCSVNTIFYFPDASKAISEFWRLLQSNGKLILCFTVKKDLKNKKFTKYGIKLYEVYEIEKLMKYRGFQNIKTTSGSDKYRDFVCIEGTK